MRRTLSRVKSLLVGRPQFAFPDIAKVLASAGSNPRRPASKQALGMSDRSVRRILHSDQNLHPYKLQIVNSLSDRDKEVRLQFYHIFGEY